MLTQSHTRLQNTSSTPQYNYCVHTYQLAKPIAYTLCSQICLRGKILCKYNLFVRFNPRIVELCALVLWVQTVARCWGYYKSRYVRTGCPSCRQLSIYSPKQIAFTRHNDLITYTNYSHFTLRRMCCGLMCLYLDCDF